MELRVALELGMCDFIFLRKTPEKLAHLREVAGLPNSSVQKYSTEIDFHSCLMAVGGNQIASQFRTILANVFKPVYEKGNPDGKVLMTPTHHEICDILERGTLEEFHAVLRQHFAPYLAHAKMENAGSASKPE